MNFKNKLKPISHKTIALFIITILLLPIFSLLLVAAEEQTYSNITVDEAYQRIRKNNQHHRNLVLLDVRTEYEFYSNHLYDAQLIPYDEIESRITKLADYKDFEIIVYCKSGGRSQIACELLVEYGFSRVYNMVGGIMAWVNNGYPMWSISHRVNVESLNNIIIEPIIPSPPLDCGCGCSEDSQDGSCPDDINIETTVIEESENCIITHTAITINEQIHEVTTKNTLLFNYIEILDDVIRTFQFNSIEIFGDEIDSKIFLLNYEIEHEQYNLKVLTQLIPLNSESYDIADTIVIFTTPEKSLNTLESLNFNYSPISLSELYNIISKTANDLKKIYLKSFKLTGDKAFEQLGTNYNIIKKEMKLLSILVNKGISEHNLLIQENYVTIRDACNPVMLGLCWVVIQGIELWGCGIPTWLFCFLSSTVLGYLIGPFALLYSFICGGMFATLCTFPNRAAREYYCGVLYGCF